jgi:RNA 3'-phosphate cyclase
MIVLDGTLGEGGGQIVRTALALSTLTQEPFRVTDIRAGRPEPGLKMQHVHAIKALQTLTTAQADGAELGSQELLFIPKPLKGKSIAVDIETAGSATLLLQAVLLPCCFADKAMTVEITGGTDVAWSMPIDYLREVLVPHLRRWADIDVTLVKRGYYPAGGGNVKVRIKQRTHRNDFATTADFLKELAAQGPKLLLESQGHLSHIKGIAHASKSLEDQRVAARMTIEAQRALIAQFKCPVQIRTEYAETRSPGAGNTSKSGEPLPASAGAGITLWAVCTQKQSDIDVANPIILGADALSEQGVPAEQVAKNAAQRLTEAIRSGAAADKYLADNLVPWMGLFPGSALRASAITPHTLTNIDVVKNFLPVEFFQEKNVLRSASRA